MATKAEKSELDTALMWIVNIYFSTALKAVIIAGDFLEMCAVQISGSKVVFFSRQEIVSTRDEVISHAAR